MLYKTYPQIKNRLLNVYLKFADIKLFVNIYKFLNNLKFVKKLMFAFIKFFRGQYF